MSKDKRPNTDREGLVKRGFELDRRVNHLLIAGGIGVAAVGAVLAAPAVIAGGALVAGGSIAGLEITNRFEAGYDNMRSKGVSSELGRTARLAS